MATYPTDEYGLIRREAALRSGHSDNQLAAAVRQGSLIRLIPGVAVEASEKFDGHEGRQELHRLRAIAASTSSLITGPAPPLSHASAAALHGLALLKPAIDKVHVTVPGTSGGSVGSHRHLHAATLTPDEIVVVEGVRATSLERTAVDVAMTGDFAQALTVFDQALRMKADTGAMKRLLHGSRRRGARVARTALPHANGLSESVGESWSRAQMVEGGLPVPRLQRQIVVASGRLYRTDFDWEWLLVGEFDGMTKYGRRRRAGESVRDALLREKRREDEISATGPRMIRWTWATLEAGELVPMLRMRLARLGLPTA